jgi:hypothetical protein
MGKKRIPTELVPTEIDDIAYGAVLADIADLLESARHAAARSVNSIMTATYWAVGRRIVEEEQQGKKTRGLRRAARHTAGEGSDCPIRAGIGHRNLYQMRQFYIAYPRILGGVLGSLND